MEARRQQGVRCGQRQSQIPEQWNEYNDMGNPLYGLIDTQGCFWPDYCGTSTFASTVVHRSGHCEPPPVSGFYTQSLGSAVQQGALTTSRPAEHDTTHNTKPIRMAYGAKAGVGFPRALPATSPSFPDPKQRNYKGPNNPSFSGTNNQIQTGNYPCEFPATIMQASAIPQNPMVSGTYSRPSESSGFLNSSDVFVLPSYQTATTGSSANTASIHYREAPRKEKPALANHSPTAENATISDQGNPSSGQMVCNKSSGPKPRKKRTLSADGKLHARAIRQIGGACELCRRKKTKVRALPTADV